MKTTIKILAIIGLMATISCKKNKCYECHYDGPNGAEVELGEKCGDEVHELEENVYTVDSVTYTVHCGEH